METTISHITVSTNYTDPELEALYETLIQEQLTAATVKGKNDGKDNKPSNVQHYKVQRLNLIKSAIQTLININHSKHQPLCDMAVMQKMRSDSNAKLHDLRNEKKVKEVSLEQARNDEKQKKAQLKTGLIPKLHYFVIYLFGIMEGGLIYTVLRMQSDSLLANLLVSCAVTFFASYGLNVGAEYIANGLTKTKQRIRYVVVLIVGFAFSGILGLMRSDMNNETAAINAQIDMSTVLVSSNPLLYVVVSFLSFWVMLALELKYFKSKEEKARIKDYDEKRKEVEGLEREFNAIQEEIDSITEDVDSNSDLVLRRQEYAASLEHRLITLAQQIVEHYEATNVDFRTDHQCPAFFGEKIDFGFTLFYQHLFTPLNQQP